MNWAYGGHLTQSLRYFFGIHFNNYIIHLLIYGVSWKEKYYRMAKLPSGYEDTAGCVFLVWQVWKCRALAQNDETYKLVIFKLVTPKLHINCMYCAKYSIIFTYLQSRGLTVWLLALTSTADFFLHTCNLTFVKSRCQIAIF